MNLENHIVTDKWYVVQIFDPAKNHWEDLLDNDFTLSQAKREMCLANCGGHKARIIERIAAFRPVAEKYFTGFGD